VSRDDGRRGRTGWIKEVGKGENSRRRVPKGGRNATRGGGKGRVERKGRLGGGGVKKKEEKAGGMERSGGG